MKVAIIIPAHNERQSLPQVLKDTPRIRNSKVFVIDDGSTDGTYKIARKQGVEVIRHRYNLGIGAALKTGYTLAREWGAKIIIQLDADGQHDPKDIPRFLESLQDKNDIVIGSRFLSEHAQTNISFIRILGVVSFTFLINVITGYKLSDITSGFRAFKIENLEKIIFPSNNQWAIEMIVLASRFGLRIKEIPIKAKPRKGGRSQFSFILFMIYPLRILKQLIELYF